MTHRTVATAAELDALIGREEAVLLYVAGAHCNVCHALRPQVEALCTEELPQRLASHREGAIAMPPGFLVVIDAEALPEATAQRMIFTVPTVLLYLDGREILRRSRSWSMAGLADELERMLVLRFGDPA